MSTNEELIAKLRARSTPLYKKDQTADLFKEAADALEATSQERAVEKSDELIAAEAELREWCHPTSPKSRWNDVHGSVTGDYPGQWERSDRADAAAVERLTRVVEALRMLEGFTPPAVGEEAGR